MQIQVLIHKIISGALNRKVVCYDLPERPGAGHVGGAAAEPAELWHICVFIVRRGGGKGGRRLNSIYSSVVFRKEREIEFMKRCERKRASEGEAETPRPARSRRGDAGSSGTLAAALLALRCGGHRGRGRSGAGLGRGAGPAGAARLLSTSRSTNLSRHGAGKPARALRSYGQLSPRGCSPSSARCAAGSCGHAHVVLGRLQSTQGVGGCRCAFLRTPFVRSELPRLRVPQRRVVCATVRTVLRPHGHVVGCVHIPSDGCLR